MEHRLLVGMYIFDSYCVAHFEQRDLCVQFLCRSPAALNCNTVYKKLGSPASKALEERVPQTEER